MSERFELSCCLFNEQDMDFIRDTKTNEEYVTLDELVPILNQQSERIAELEEQLKNARKETANKVIKRVEELSVFDFQVYEEMNFRRYIISEMALENILREYGE